MKLRTALAHPRITVGSHTWSHANLASLSTREISLELGRCREWLQAEFAEKTVDWLAYPYGLDSSAARRALAASSYTGALRISGGWHTTQSVSRFARPRLNVSAGHSIAGLRARLLGAVNV
jgi:peptidoglycan/xylan/chitin deacetylase (PgdA/CDA1 family)